MMSSRGNEMAMQFVSSFGPGGIAAPLNAMTQGRANPETMQQALTGMNRKELSQLDQLAASGPMLRQQLAEAARKGIQEGAASIGPMDAIKGALNAITKPLQDKFRRFGAEMTQSIQQTLSDVTREFVSSPPKSADPSSYMNEFRAIMSGNQGTVDYLRNQRSSGERSLGGFTRGFGQVQKSQMGGFMGDLIGGLPMGLRMGALPPGTTPGDLPGYGMLSESYNPRGSAFAMTSAASVFGGRNAFGAAGHGLMRGGSGVMNMFNATQAGPMGVGGLGMVSGTGRMAGGAAWLGGAALKGFGAATRALGPGMMAADLAFNVFPEMQRRTGQRGITEGAILGRNANMLRFLSEQGALGSAGLEELRVGSMSGGIDADEVTRRGLIPVGGLIPGQDMGSGISGPGSQMFGTQKTLDAAHRLFDDSMDVSDLYNQYGGENDVKNKMKQILSDEKGSTDSEKIAAIQEKFPGITNSEAWRLALNPGVNDGKKFLSVGYGGRGSIESERDVQDAKEAVQEAIQNAGDDSANAVNGLNALRDMGADYHSDLGREFLSGGAGGQSTEDISLSKDEPTSKGGKGGKITSKKQLQQVMGAGNYRDIGNLLKGRVGRRNKKRDGESPAAFKERRVKNAVDRVVRARAALAKSGLMAADKEETVASVYNSLLSDARYNDTTKEGKQKIVDKLSEWIQNQDEDFGGLEMFSGGSASENSMEKSETASDIARLVVEGKGNFGDVNIMTGEDSEAALGAYKYRQGVRDDMAKTRADDKMTFETLGGITGITEDMEAEATKIMESVSGATEADWKKGDPRVSGRKDFGEWLVKNKDLMSDKARDKMIARLGEGGAVSQDLSVVMNNFRYYDKLWQNNKNNPTRFLEKITGESFKGLADDLKRFQSGKTQLSSDLEDNLIAGAKRVWKAAHPGEEVDETQIRKLAYDIGMGASKGGSDELNVSLSTQHAPKDPSGAKGAGEGFVSAMNSATGAIQNFIHNSGI
jgi:hypothetical protein